MSSLTYVDPHTEKSFSWNGKNYYVSQLYGTRLHILAPTLFTPLGVKSITYKPFVLSSGNTVPVDSSSTMNGKPIVLFNIPNENPADVQYYAFLDTTKLIPTTVITPKAQQDTHEANLDTSIKTTIEVGKLSGVEQIINSLFPGNSFLWIKKNGKWVLIGGLGLALFGKPLLRSLKKKIKR